MIFSFFYNFERKTLKLLGFRMSGIKFFFTSCSKNSWLFLGEPLEFFISSCFHFFMFSFFMFSFLLISVSSYFRFFLFSFRQVFLLMIPFIYFTISSMFVLLRQVQRISFLLSGSFLPYTPFLHLSRLPLGWQFCLEGCRASH